MNITFLSLISLSLHTNSPFLVGNRLFLTNCKFQRISSLLFFNQRNLYLKSVLFNQAINGIIHNDNEITIEGPHIIVQNEQFEDIFQKTIDKPSSLSIIECTFTNINNKNAIYVNNQVSLYITKSFFSSCKNTPRVINLGQLRCVTVTHCCVSQCSSNLEAIFLYADCKENDFSLFLYNTMIDTERTGNSNDGSVIFSKSGSHYYRCNNITNSKSKGIQFEASYCYSFAMNTIMNCDSHYIQITGNVNQKSLKKYIDNVNLFSNSGSSIFLLEVQNMFDLIIENSVILSNTNNVISYNNIFPNIIFNNCIINDNFDTSKAQINDCTLVSYSLDHLTIHPHFTYKDVCVGPVLEKNTDAFGCNAGNCIDNVCNKTIGFPDDVVPFSTLIHLDMQTATFLPTETFYPSKEFSKSDEFSQSFKFSDSSKFSETFKFSESLKFSESDHFTSTFIFSQSSLFSESNQFSSSSKFSQTFYFSQSIVFSETEKFSFSSKFSETEKFSISSQFSESSQFSLSNSFALFSDSDHFTISKEFSDSSKFTKSIQFSDSKIFSHSNDFSSSDKFSYSNKFNSSSIFSSSKIIQSSTTFSESRQFSSSQKFLFSSSNHFSLSSFLKKPNNTDTDTTMKRNKKSRKLPIIIGVTIAAAVLVACAIIAVCCFVCVPIVYFGEEEEEEAEDIETIDDFYANNPLYTEDFNPSRDPYISDSEDIIKFDKKEITPHKTEFDE